MGLSIGNYMYDISSPFPAITSLKTFAKLGHQLRNFAPKSFSRDPLLHHSIHGVREYGTGPPTGCTLLWKSKLGTNLDILPSSDATPKTGTGDGCHETATCDMKLLHSTLCLCSWLTKSAKFLWHQAAAIRCYAAALRRPQGIVLSGTWATRLLHELLWQLRIRLRTWSSDTRTNMGIIMSNPKAQGPCSNLSPVIEADEVTSIVGMFVTPTASITGLEQTTCTYSYP